MVVCSAPSELETVQAIQRREVQIGGESARLPKDDITDAGIRIAIRVGEGSADNHIRKSVAVDVAGAADRGTRKVADIASAKPKAVLAVKAADVQPVKWPSRTEHDVRLTRGRSLRSVGENRADHHVIEPVAID